MHLGPCPLALALAATCAAALLGCDARDDEPGTDGGGSAGIPADGLPPEGVPPDAVPADGRSDTAVVAGLYDARYEDLGAIDVAYVEISGDGAWTEHDYQGDDFDGGANCYVSIAYRLERVAGDRYRIARPDVPGRAREARLVRAADSLRVTYADAAGGTDNSVTEVWPLLEGLSATDFVACRAAPGADMDGP